MVLPQGAVSSTNDALADAIDERGPDLAKVVLQRVFEDPFWDIRFGKRGRFHTERDGNYHLSYLTQALRARSAAVMVDYARWLRSVLVTRGMCSEHLAENFRLFQAALKEASIQDADRACAMLEQAALGLMYTDGLAGQIDAHATSLAAELGVPDTPLAGERDIRRHLSFLADSISLNRPDLFGSYCAFLERGWSAVAPLASTLDGIVDALERRLSPGADAPEDGRPGSAQRADGAVSLRSYIGRCRESLSADDARA